MTDRAANVEKAFYEAQRNRFLAGNRPGPDASPTDRALYHYEGRRDIIGVVHQALDYYRLYADMILETEHPLMSAMVVQLKVRGPRDESELRMHLRGIISMDALARQRQYRATLMFEFMYNYTNMPAFDEYALPNIRNWLIRTEHSFARHIRNGKPEPLPEL